MRDFTIVSLGLIGLFWTIQVLASNTDQLDGVWQLESATYTYADGQQDKLEGKQLSSIKIVHNGYFSFVSQWQDGRFHSAGSGQCQLDGNRYVEQLQLASHPSLTGKTFSFTWQVDNGKWIHSGEENGMQIREIWRRLPANEALANTLSVKKYAFATDFPVQSDRDLTAQ